MIPDSNITFSAEQQAEIDKMLKAAKAQEQYKIAGLQAYKFCLNQLANATDQYDPQTKQLVRQGAFEPIVLEVFQNEYRAFLLRNFPQPKTEKVPEAEPE